MVASKISLFPFHPSLLVSPSRIAELGVKPPVRSEGDKPLRLVPLVSPQNLLHRAAEVVIPQQPEYSSEVGERQFVRFQKGLLRGARIANMKCSPTEHAPHAEDLLLLL